MKISFTGMYRNAVESLVAIEGDVDHDKELENDPHYEGFDNFVAVKVCLEAYHDILLALLKGDATIAEARELLALDGDRLEKAEYLQTVITV